MKWHKIQYSTSNGGSYESPVYDTVEIFAENEIDAKNKFLEIQEIRAKMTGNPLYRLHVRIIEIYEIHKQ